MAKVCVNLEILDSIAYARRIQFHKMSKYQISRKTLNTNDGFSSEF